MAVLKNSLRREVRADCGHKRQLYRELCQDARSTHLVNERSYSRPPNITGRPAAICAGALEL